MRVLKGKTQDFTEPWLTMFERTLWRNVSIYAPVDKLPHANTAPIIFIGDSCHPMVPFSGTALLCQGRRAYSASRA